MAFNTKPRVVLHRTGGSVCVGKIKHVSVKEKQTIPNRNTNTTAN